MMGANSRAGPTTAFGRPNAVVGPARLGCFRAYTHAYRRCTYDIYRSSIVDMADSVHEAPVVSRVI